MALRRQSGSTRASPPRATPRNWRRIPTGAWLLLSLLAGRPAGAEAPPEALFFGVSGVKQRLRLDPPLVTVSGGVRLELSEVDRLAGDSEPLIRLLVRAVSSSPEALTVHGDAFAADAGGRELAPLPPQTFSTPTATWLVFTFVAGPSTRLAVFSAAVGPAPRVEEQRRRVDLTRLAEPVRWPGTALAALPTVVRRETSPLPVADEAPPLYRGLDSVLGRSDEPPAADAAHPYLTLRLFTLAPLEAADDWRLTRLDWPDRPGPADWRYRRLLWRPDWGAVLGAKGRDWKASEQLATGPGRGVMVEAVADGSPAAAAGLRVGDLLTVVDGQAVVEAYSLGEQIRMTRPGATVRCEVWRDGRRLTLAITVSGKPLWSDVDDVEFGEAWTQLAPLADSGRGAVLSLWDWQTRAPLPAGYEPSAVELVFTRPAPAETTTFLFRQVPVASPSR